MKYTFWIYLGISILGILMGPPLKVSAATLSVTSTYDTFIEWGTGGYGTTTNHGTDFSLWVENTPSYITHSLLKVILPAEPEAGATITSSSLFLYIENVSNQNTATATMSIYDITRDWVETTATWNRYSIGNNWTMPGMQSGADYSLPAHDTVGMVSSTGHWFHWCITGSECTHSKTLNWGTTYDFVLRADQSLDMRWMAFDSGEANETWKRPYIGIDYITTPSPPSSTTSTASLTDDNIIVIVLLFIATILGLDFIRRTLMFNSKYA